MIEPNDPDLEALEEYLRSDDSPPNCMMLSDLDGFLTGIVVGPELIMPSEWLPVIWGGDEPKFDSSKQATAIISAIMGRYNEVIRLIGEDPPGLDPIFWETSDGDVIVGDWAAGFVDAMRLRPEAWRRLSDDEDHGRVLLPMLALTSDEDGGWLVPLSEETRQRIADEAPDLVPSCVFEIYDFWRARR